jgi:hypothetical protein
MSVRQFMAAVGAVAVMVGAVFLLVVPVRVHSAYVGGVSCQTFSTDGRSDGAAARKEGFQIITDRFLGRKPRGATIAEQCRAATSTRRARTIPLAGVGALLLIGSAVVRAPGRTGPPEGMVEVKCTRCNAVQNIPRGAKEFECWQCHLKTALTT